MLTEFKGCIVSESWSLPDTVDAVRDEDKGAKQPIANCISPLTMRQYGRFRRWVVKAEGEAERRDGGWNG
jgi:hypothetical protein